MLFTYYKDLLCNIIIICKYPKAKCLIYTVQQIDNQINFEVQ